MIITFCCVFLWLATLAVANLCLVALLLKYHRLHNHTFTGDIIDFNLTLKVKYKVRSFVTQGTVPLAARLRIERECCALKCCEQFCSTFHVDLYLGSRGHIVRFTSFIWQLEGLVEHNKWSLYVTANDSHRVNQWWKVHLLPVLSCTLYNFEVLVPHCYLLFSATLYFQDCTFYSITCIWCL